MWNCEETAAKLLLPPKTAITRRIFWPFDELDNLELFDVRKAYIGGFRRIFGVI